MIHKNVKKSGEVQGLERPEWQIFIRVSESAGSLLFQTPTMAILEREDGVRRHGIERSCCVESDLKMNVIVDEWSGIDKGREHVLQM